MAAHLISAAISFGVSLHLLYSVTHMHVPGRVAQSVTFLATDACLTAEFDPGPVPYFHGDSLVPNSVTTIFGFSLIGRRETIRKTDRR